jgi:diguanylate cyclase (GGDEF)-like protein
MFEISGKIADKLAAVWSATTFDVDELDTYAEHFMTGEIRRGVTALGLVSLLLLAGAAVLYERLGFSSAYTYTCALLGVLALHVTLSSQTLKQIEVLYLLSVTLLVVSGSAFVLLAHQTGDFSAALMSSVVLLFIVIPLVPWGLREALAVVLMIYLVFTLSTLGAQEKFDVRSLWILQFMMLGSALATLTIVARNVGVRKDDIRARFQLESAHQEMERLSYEDALTGAWNRRYLDIQFRRLIRRLRDHSNQVCFALLDVDDFKNINDTRGHSYGDLVLQTLVQSLHARLGDLNHVFRVGGDEFALLFDKTDATAWLAQAARDMQEILDRHNGADKEPVRLSMGVIEVSDFCDIHLDSLYQEADKALYLAKGRKQTGEDLTNVVVRSSERIFSVKKASH